MARTALTVQQIDADGLEPALTAANVDGHSVANDVGVYVEVANGSGASIDVTVPTPATQDGLAISDRVVAVPAGETRKIGPFPSRTYNQDDGTVHVDFSAVTSVTVGAFKA